MLASMASPARRAASSPQVPRLLSGYGGMHGFLTGPLRLCAHHPLSSRLSQEPLSCGSTLPYLVQRSDPVPCPLTVPAGQSPAFVFLPPIITMPLSSVVLGLHVSLGGKKKYHKILLCFLPAPARSSPTKFF